MQDILGRPSISVESQVLNEYMVLNEYCSTIFTVEKVMEAGEFIDKNSDALKHRHYKE